MNAFCKVLKRLVQAPPFCGNQRTLAQHAGCDQGLLSRVLNGKRPTPEFVGRLCGTLPAEQAAELLQSYLSGVVETVASTKRKAKTSRTWTPALKHVDVAIQCHGRRKSA